MSLNNRPPAAPLGKIGSKRKTTSRKRSSTRKKRKRSAARTKGVRTMSAKQRKFFGKRRKR